MEYTLEKLEVYQLAELFADKIWQIVAKWDYFKKDTIGKQLVRAADSISANIAEGYGRYFYKESKQFYFYARGSIQETKAWLSKCKRRDIEEAKLCDELIEEAEKILAMLNAFIKFVSKSQSAPLQRINDSTNKPINNLTDKPINNSTNKSINNSTNKPLNNLTDKPLNNLTDKPING